MIGTGAEVLWQFKVRKYIFFRRPKYGKIEARWQEVEVWRAPIHAYHILFLMQFSLLTYLRCFYFKILAFACVSL